MSKLKQIAYIALLIIAVAFIAGSVVAQTTEPSYPIKELGNCRNVRECYFYCEIPPNKAACWSYGKYVLNKDVLGEKTNAEMEVKAHRLGIIFPISELGNCTNVGECRNYCENPDNYDACTDFAKKHGIHRGDEKKKQEKETLVKQAKTELGCTSESGCRAFCDRPENHDRCRTFATRHGVHTSAGLDPEKMRMLEKARKELDCDSIESCRSICEQDRERCMDFARRHGFNKNIDHDQIPPKGGPGGCKTEEECERYCREHKEECRRNFEETDYGPKLEDRRYGQGGCDSEESCRRYCEEHPDECPGLKDEEKAYKIEIQEESSDDRKSSESYYVGPSGCKTDEECRHWCKEHPNECPGFKESSDFEERQDYSEQEDIPREEEYYKEEYIKDEDYKKYDDNKDYSSESYGDDSGVEDPASFDQYLPKR